MRREALELYRTTNEVVSDAQYERAAISMLEQCPSDLPYSTTDISWKLSYSKCTNNASAPLLPPSQTSTAIHTRPAHSVKIRPSHQQTRQHVFVTRSVSPAHRACIDAYASLPSALHRTLRIAAVDAWLYICDATASAFALLGLTAARHRVQCEFDDAMGAGEHRV